MISQDQSSRMALALVKSVCQYVEGRTPNMQVFFRRAGIVPKNWVDYQTGEMWMSLPTLVRIAGTFGMKVSDLLLLAEA